MGENSHLTTSHDMCMHTQVTTKIDLCEMQNCLCFAIRRASRVMTQFFVTRLKDQPLLPTQTPILGYLAVKPEATMAEMSSMLDLDRTTLIRNLRALKRDGYVKSSGSGQGNKVTLTLTARGRTALEDLYPAWREIQRKAIETLGEERWSEILKDLERVEAALKEEK
jgi:DNA-binding MarR family transcriptional regulator